ncbi:MULTISPECIES: hypothetical protein [unclassified Oleiphilus]|nr:MULTISPECIES: hypothetical protein [unclassified Oleiphilus]
MNQISPRDTMLELGTQLKNAFKTLSSSSSNTPQPIAESSAESEIPSTSSIQGLEQIAEQKKRKDVQVKNLTKEIGEQRAYLNEVIKNKLSEYGLAPNTQLKIEKLANGKLAVQGPVVQSQLERIGFELSQDNHFVSAYTAVSKQNPTLEYASNVNKLTQAYGQTNKVFQSLLSEKNEFNQLKDITLRYQSLLSQTEFKSASEA